MQEIWQPHTCLEYTAAMNEIRELCEEEGTVPLYHYTDPRFAKSILSGGLRMSTQGQVRDDQQVNSGKMPSSWKSPCQIEMLLL